MNGALATGLDKTTMIGVIGLILLLPVVLLTGCASFVAEEPDQPVEAVAVSPTHAAPTQVVETPTPISTPEPEAAAASDQITTANTDSDSSVTVSEDSDTVDLGATPSTSPEPEIGEITFALGATADYQPVDPGLFFTKGITEVHAIFNYSGMSPDYTWERVWYLNDKEVARITETWVGAESGAFDYFINNSGRPLPAGDWVLELYVEGKLHALGVFIIEDTE
jgi:hypothetical protein